MIRIIPFVDHEIGYRLLEKLLSISKLGFGIDIPAVVTTYENGRKWWPGVERLCSIYNLRIYLYPKDRTVIETFSNIDWIFLLSWKFIIPLSTIKSVKEGIVNLHYSLLPKYRGVYPINWAIMNGEKETGITYHLVDESIDSGKILIQKRLCISCADTARSLQIKLDDLAYKAFDELLMRIKSDNDFNIVADPKNTHSCYKSRKEFESTNELDLNRKCTVKEVINLIRGKTFLPETKNLFYRCPDTGYKCYLRLEIEHTNEK